MPHFFIQEAHLPGRGRGPTQHGTSQSRLRSSPQAVEDDAGVSTATDDRGFPAQVGDGRAVEAVGIGVGPCRLSFGLEGGDHVPRGPATRTALPQCVARYVDPRRTTLVILAGRRRVGGGRSSEEHRA